MAKKLPGKSVLYGLYVNQELSLADIGNKYGTSRAAVSLALERAGIPRRSKSEARLLALDKGKLPHHRAHTFNRAFFREWSNPMAYLLGLIYADGHISKNGVLRFGFGAKSVGLAGIVCELLDSDRAASVVDNNGFPSWQLQFCSRPMTEDLRALGAFTGEYPRDMPQGYDRHFIRGYFDGCGKVSTRIKFYSPSHRMLESIQDRLNQDRCIMSPITPDSDLHSLVYASKSGLRAIYSYFYDDVPEGEYSEWTRRAFANLLKPLPDLEENPPPIT